MEISAWTHSVDADGAMKQCDEALTASLLQFFKSFKCFIASLLQLSAWC
jgi:hypothetical protein